MSHHPRCIRFQTAAGFDPNIPCTCGAASWLPTESTASTPFELVGLHWARADRAADDRTADLQGIERVIAATKPPIPVALLAELQAARERAMTALREACIAEGRAETALKEAAHRLLDAGTAGDT